MSSAYDISRDRERLNTWYPLFAPLPAETRVRRDAPVGTEAGRTVTPPTEHACPPAIGAVPRAVPIPADPPATPNPAAEHKTAGPRPTIARTAPLETPPPWLTVGTRTVAKRRAPARTLAGVALAVIAAGGVAVVATSSERVTTANLATADPVPAAVQSWCPSSNTGDTVTGNGPGGQQDGPSAILAFDYAYYVLRSGEQARAVVAHDAATVSSAQVIQAAIDTAIPSGTEHCLAIVADPVEVERYWVTLSERRPDSTLENYQQIVTTADQGGGRHVITSIGAAE